MCAKTLQHGNSHGFTVFHYSNWQCDFTECGKWNWIRCRGCGYSRRQTGDVSGMSFDAMGSTMATYGGQNVGAGDLDRVNKGLKSCSLLGLIYSVLAVGIVYAVGRQMLLLFLDTGETGILENAYAYVRTNVIFYFPLALVNIVRFLIQGMGFSKLAVFAGAFEMLARGLAGFLLVPYFGFSAVRFANPLAWIFADIFLIPAFFYVRRTMAGILDRQKEQ